MSCQMIQRRGQYDHQAMNCPMEYETVGPYADKSDSYASLDTAFNESRSMAEFQNKMMSHNPLLGQHLMDQPYDPSADSINRNLSQMMGQGAAKSPSEKKMNDSIDEVMGSMRIYDSMVSDNYPAGAQSRSVCESNIKFPLTRTQHYDSNKLGTTLLEGLDPLLDLQREYRGLQSQTRESTGMGIFKLILLIVLIAILLYGAYYLCTNGNKRGTKIAVSPGTESVSREVSQFFKKLYS